MPLKTAQKVERAFDQSTVALSASSVSFQSSKKHYFDEEFTLNPAPKNGQGKSKKQCLAMEVAQTFPPKIKQQVVKIVEYYETVVEQQVNQFHKLVEQNNRLKKENERLKAQSEANMLSGYFKCTNYEVSQLRQPLAPLKPSNKECAETTLKKKVEELQAKVDSKDKKINELAKQLGNLTPRVKKAKRKENLFLD